jgi:hypothetical protein
MFKKTNKEKVSIFIKKALRFFRITKPIELSEQEKRWIKLCKLHYKETKYHVNAGDWVETLKPMYEEVYGWSPEEHYMDFLNCMFNKLLDIYLKIRKDGSNTNAQIKSVFNAAFYKGISRNQELPIERAINDLCGLIQCNQVIVDGIPRYSLEV